VRKAYEMKGTRDFAQVQKFGKRRKKLGRQVTELVLRNIPEEDATSELQTAMHIKSKTNNV
jgi:hypothetical protein